VWLLVKEWGRIGSSGQSQVRSFTTITEAQRTFDRQRCIKKKRGYADTKSNGASK
jgi:predicted DNA-binding WGR domain protein